MKKLLIPLGLALVVVIAIFAMTPGRKSASVATATQQQTTVTPAAPPRVAYSSYTVAEGDTFASILEHWGVPYSAMLEILDAASETYDFTRVRLGRELRYDVEGGVLKRLEYDMDSEEMVIVEYSEGAYSARVEPIPYEVEQVIARGTIASSLFEAGLAAGIPEETILKLAEVFAWEVDFATEIQTGDSFAFVYEKRTRNSRPAPSGRILAGKFITSGEPHYGFYFSDPAGENGYYNEKGESLVRQFLKAPLTYSRITSGYTYARFHPTLGRSTPHLAIDYAAPQGTPVLSTAAGTVTFAGWNGGYGRFVVVHHNGTYTTRYAHLSGFARGIRPGTKVEQGQVIGYVGSTGFSTGPHLHYEIMQNGQLVNPLTIDLPAGEPIKSAYRQDFEAKIAEFKPLLDQE